MSLSGVERLVLVSDPHGCAEELSELLDRRVKYVPGRDLVVLCGDVVNKGPFSIDTLTFAQRRGLSAVCGNHDQAAIAQRRMRLSSQCESKASIRSVFNWTEEMSDTDASWLSNLPFTISFPELNLSVLHAGAVPDVPLEEQRLHDLLMLRDVIPPADEESDEPSSSSTNGSDFFNDESLALSGTRFVPCEHPKPERSGVPWASRWSGGPFLIAGHDARRKLQLYPNAMVIDTGVCYGNELTAVVVDPSYGIGECGEGTERHVVNAKREWVPPGA